MMNNMSRRSFLFGRMLADDDSGSTGIEYGIIAGMISVAIIASFTMLGDNNKKTMKCVRRGLKGKKLGKKCK